MIDFLIKYYTKFINVLLIILFPLTAALGFYIGGKFGFNVWHSLLGALIGLAGTFFIEFLLIPPVMVLFSINSKLAELTDEVDQNNNTESNPEVVWKKVKVNGITFHQKENDLDKNYYCRFCHKQIDCSFVGCPHCGRYF